jgi:hypothetical protein
MCPTYPLPSKGGSYFNDPVVDADWEHLARQHAGDAGIVYLYRLRKAICRAIDSGTITLQRGMGQFEAERQRIMDEERDRLHDYLDRHGSV